MRQGVHSRESRAPLIANSSRITIPGAYFLYHQHQPSLTEGTVLTPFKRGDLARGTHYYQAQLADAAQKTPRHLDGPKGPCMTPRGYGRMRILLVGENMPYETLHAYVSSPSQS